MLAVGIWGEYNKSMTMKFAITGMQVHPTPSGGLESILTTVATGACVLTLIVYIVRNIRSHKAENKGKNGKVS